MALSRWARRSVKPLCRPCSVQMKSQLGDVKHVMVESIEKVLERGEKIELLVDKTDRLNETAFRFEKSSRQLKEVRATGRRRRAHPPGFSPCATCSTPQTMFWKRVRMYGIATGVVGVVSLIIAMSACGVTFRDC